MSKAKRKITAKQHLVERILSRLSGGRNCIKYESKPTLNPSNAWFDDPNYGLSRRRFSDPTGVTWNKSSDDGVARAELSILDPEHRELIDAYYNLQHQFYDVARQIEKSRDNIYNALKGYIIPEESHLGYTVVSSGENLRSFINSKLSTLLHDVSECNGWVFAKPKTFTPIEDYDAPIFLVVEKNGLFLIEYHLWKNQDLILDGDYDSGKAIITKSGQFNFSDLRGIMAFIVSSTLAEQ